MGTTPDKGTGGSDPGDEEEMERICTEGSRVFSVEWDGGAPGFSGGVDVYRWQDKFAVRDPDGFDSGPFATLDEALEANGLLWVNSATVCISCSLLSATQLAERLRCSDEGGFTLEINGQEWWCDGTGAFHQSPPDDAGNLA